LRREVLRLNPALTIFDVQSMDDHLAQSALPLRMGALLLGTFGALAIALASVGLYGISAFLVRQRAREIGIRMALGASRSDTLRLVLKQCMKVVGVGVGTGCAAGSALSVVVASQLYGIASTDLMSLVIVVILQSAIALVACWMGLRPLMRLDPVMTLRCQ
jgi:ABC-type antimicrobial peptide transport system permease subunit